jgi:putative ABC transport system permease protein
MHYLDDFLAAWRGLRHSTAFLALASTVLALGLGATIFTYGVINTIVLKPPPLPGADRLYAVLAAEPARKEQYDSLSYVDFLELKQHQRTFEDLAAHFTGTVIIAGDDVPERYSGAMVTWNFMRVLGVKPLLGRDFTPADDVPTADPVVILSYEVWRSRFKQNPAVIGHTVRVNALTSTIIGVMPPRFSYPENEQLWVPMARDVAKERRGDQSYESAVGVGAVGRLAAGVTPQQASDDMAAIAARLAKLYPRTNSGVTTHVMPMAEALIGSGKAVMYGMFAAVWLVLLTACANVASLIFVRANFRVYEASMRMALGAPRSRLVAQMLAESLIVSFIGVCGGIVIAAIGLHLMEVAMQSQIELRVPVWWRFNIDLRVAAFAGAAALLAALLSGIVPALRASRPNVMRILRDGGRTGTGLRLSKFTTAMVIVELALSASLLTGAGLMTRASVLSLQQDYGADVRGFMSGRVGLPLAKYPVEEQSRFFDQIVKELRAQPGVLAATAATSMPGTGADEWRFGIEGRTYEDRADYPFTQMVTTTPGFFAAFRRPIFDGRDFDEKDRADAPAVALVNQAFVRRFFPHENALGRRVVSPDDPAASPMTIVGVVSNINHDDSWQDGDFPPTLYRPVSQKPWRFMTVAIRTRGDPHGYGELVREVTQRLDPDLAPYWIKTLEEYQAQKRAVLRVLSHVFSAFAVIAIILSAVGIYGVLAFATGQRNREIGVRRALGAHDRQILGTVMRSAAFQLICGLALGSIVAPLLARALRGGLQGLPPDDPVIYIIVFMLLVCASLLASWIPAVRALKVQPATALRRE